MKTKGSTFLYEEERNEDLMRCFQEKASNNSMLVISDVFNEVVNSPSSRFWVSERRAAVVVSDLIRGRDALRGMKPQKKEMYMEIFRRTLERIKEGTKETLFEIVSSIVCSPAPKFYLTPDSAKIIYYRCRNAWYDRKRRSASLHANLAQLWKETYR